jgi:large subunit ribosomal protein L17
MRNLACALIEHGQIKTTVPKAKNVRQYLERIITIAKAGLAANDDAGVGLAKRRLAFSYLNNKEAVKKLFNDVAPTCTQRPGGYTRIVRCGVRQGDGAPMCYIELVDAPGPQANSAAAEDAAPAKRKRAPKAASGEASAAAE